MGWGHLGIASSREYQGLSFRTAEWPGYSYEEHNQGNYTSYIDRADESAQTNLTIMRILFNELGDHKVFVVSACEQESSTE